MPAKGPDPAVAVSTSPSLIAIPSGKWNIDPAASRLEFRVKTMWGFVDVHGHFTSYQGTLTVDEHGGASGKLTIDVASIDTKNAKRDAHLLSSDFFHSEAHPTVNFVSNAITTAADGLTISGDLHVRDKSVRLQLPVTVTPLTAGRMRLQTSANVSREHAGMIWNKVGMIRGDARLEGEIEFVRED